MIFSLDTARDMLRIDGTDNDTQILSLLEAIPLYLQETTGYQPTAAEEFSPIAKTAGQFLLWQWYFGENSDTDKIQRVIDCLLKALSAERELPNGAG